MLRTVHAQPTLGGIYHAVASGETSWYGYARHVIEFARREGQAVRVIPQDVTPVPTSAYPTAATRPHNSRLDTRKLQHSFGLALPDWRIGVDRMLREVLN
jgi:dTDP-4-dehydrorhamnose reductase